MKAKKNSSNKNYNEKEYIAECLTDIPPVDCLFKVGDSVMFTNGYGVKFGGKTIIGFSKLVKLPGRFVHLNGSAPYWMPMAPKNLTLMSEIPKTNNAQRVLQLMDSEENGNNRYQEFVKLVAKDVGISTQQLGSELEPFI